MVYKMTTRLKEWLDRYRVWPEADTDLIRDFDELVNEAEDSSNELDALNDLVITHRLHELHDVDDIEHNDVDQVEKALQLLTGVRELHDQHQTVELFMDSAGLADLQKLLQKFDALEEFRSLILGVLKETGALPKDAFPDDDRLVTMVRALMP